MKKAYGDSALRGLCSVLPPGGIRRVIGRTVRARSTLVASSSGREPEAASCASGNGKIAYAPERDSLDPNKTVFDEIAGGSDMIGSRSYQTPTAPSRPLQFQGGEGEARGDLAGGEPRRHLAQVLKTAAPSCCGTTANDLDVETLRAMEPARSIFPAVRGDSHDRCSPPHRHAYPRVEGDRKAYGRRQLRRYLDTPQALARSGHAACLRFKPLS